MRLTLDKGTLFLNMKGKPKRIIHLTKTLNIREKKKRKNAKNRLSLLFFLLYNTVLVLPYIDMNFLKS